MKKIALILALIALPISTSLAYDLFLNDQLRTEDSYRLTHRNAYEAIRSQDFVPAEFANTGKNKLYQTNVGEEIPDALPGIRFGEECLTWKSCRQLSIRKANNFRGLHVKRRITGDRLEYDRAMYDSLIGASRARTGRTEVAGNLSGVEKLKRLQALVAHRGTK